LKGDADNLLRFFTGDEMGDNRFRAIEGDGDVLPLGLGAEWTKGMGGTSRERESDLEPRPPDDN
jgi:hypothetical protein